MATLISPQTKDTPAETTPAVAKMRPELEIVRDLYEGYETLRNKSYKYLPMHPGEESEDYLIRLSRPTLFNAFARTIKGLAGMVFKTDPTLVAVPNTITTLYENLDNAGTHGHVFLRDLFTDALVTGMAFIFVDMPAVENASELTRADEMNMGLRPFWTFVRKDDLVSFRSVTENGRTFLSQVIFKTTEEIPSGPYGSKEVEIYKILRRELSDDGTPQITFQNAMLVDGEWTSMGSGVISPVTEIPFVPVYTEKTGFFTSRPPMIDMAYLNVLHYQTTSDMHHAAHIACVPVLFGKGISDEDLKVGPNSAIIVEDANEGTDVRWLETQGTSIGSTRQLLQDMEKQMATLGLGMLQRETRAAETADAKRIDKSEQDSALSAAVTSLENGVARALAFTAEFLGLPSGGKIEFERKFDVEPAAAQSPRRDTAPRKDEPDMDNVGQ